MWLVDTSVWIETFRRRQPLNLESLVPLDEVVTALPIVQEVLQGFDDERAFRVARDAMLALTIVESPISADLVLEASQLYRSARRAGLTIRSSTDCLLAACAIRHHLTILHVDRDFEYLATVAPLKTRRIPRRGPIP